MTHQETLIKLALEVNALKFGEFTLKSGRVSPYFFNTGLFNTGHSLKVLGECYAKSLQASGLDFDMIFGPAYKGITLASTTAIALAAEGRDVPYAFNRKEVKAHGEGGLLVGSPIKGRVLIIDDVISAGTAANESAQIIQAEGGSIAGVIVALNRQERGEGPISAVSEIEQRYKVPVLSIITLQDLIVYTERDPAINQRMLAYYEQYGA